MKLCSVFLRIPPYFLNADNLTLLSWVQCAWPKLLFLLSLAFPVGSISWMGRTKFVPSVHWCVLYVCYGSNLMFTNVSSISCICLIAWVYFSAFNEAPFLRFCLPGQSSKLMNPNLFLELSDVSLFCVSAWGPILAPVLLRCCVLPECLVAWVNACNEANLLRVSLSGQPSKLMGLICF